MPAPSWGDYVAKMLGLAAVVPLCDCVGCREGVRALQTYYRLPVARRHTPWGFFVAEGLSWCVGWADGMSVLAGDRAGMALEVLRAARPRVTPSPRDYLADGMTLAGDLAPEPLGACNREHWGARGRGTCAYCRDEVANVAARHRPFVVWPSAWAPHWLARAMGGR